ncbi:mediator complex, subunit Med5 [Lipomyces oligophaga]|uniref:mediator complex, subunit Med5 n=1 Tax=Lipomyces oligophaga TaxID=45792 RepID=UPI0034CFF7D1
MTVDRLDDDTVTVASLTLLCLRQRVIPGDFLRYVKELLSNSSLSEEKICHDLIQVPITTCTDPLHVQYLTYAIIDNSPVASLSALLNCLETADTVFLLEFLLEVSKVIETKWSFPEQQDLDSLLDVLARLMQNIVERSELLDEVELLENKDENNLLEQFRATVGSFLIQLCKNSWFIKRYKNEFESKSKDNFETSIKQFYMKLHVIDESLSTELASAVGNFIDQSESTSVQLDVKSGAGKVRSSSDKLSWLEAMMKRRPELGSTEFIAQISKLLRIESADIAISRLVGTAFDSLLICAMKQDLARVPLWKLFIVNRLPLVLGTPPLNELPSSMFEVALRRPLLNLDESALALVNNSSENDFDMMFAATSTAGTLVSYDIRREFLKSLTRLGLIDHGAVERVLGGESGEEIIEQESVAAKEDMMRLITESFDFENSIKQFISKIEGLDCLSQGPAIDTIVQLLSIWTEQKETYKLRILSQELASSTQTMNIMLLYRDPYDVLRPLISCLDNWSYEDETNYQDNYTDFGLILLLICSLYFHFDLDIKLIRFESETSFCRKYLSSSGTAHSIEELSQEQSDLLGGWIMALYDTNGISDELMKSCSPMEYLLLVPTIFQQSVVACNRSFLDIDTLKGGLEYFFQPFLLASVTSALHWLGHHLWTLQDIEVPLLILQALVIPPSPSEESEPIHRLALQIGALPVYNVLQEILRPDRPKSDGGLPNSVNYMEIINALTPYLQFRKEL